MTTFKLFDEVSFFLPVAGEDPDNPRRALGIVVDFLPLRDPSRKKLEDETTVVKIGVMREKYPDVTYWLRPGDLTKRKPAKPPRQEKDYRYGDQEI